MANLDISDFDRYALAFDELAKMPDSVLTEMCEAGGEIIRKTQAKTAERMLQGKYYKGAVAKNVKLGKVRRSRRVVEVYINFEGKQHGIRIAEIAYINEYGKKNQPARPFIKTANEECADRAVDAAAKIYNDYLDKTGL